MKRKKRAKRKMEYNQCPKGHKVPVRSRSTIIVTRCGDCHTPVAFYAASWACPLCSGTEALAGDNDPFFLLQRCPYCRRYYIMAWREDTNACESFFMSEAEESEFFGHLKSGSYEKSAGHVCGIVSMYETQVNLGIAAEEPDVEVDDIVDNY